MKTLLTRSRLKAGFPNPPPYPLEFGCGDDGNGVQDNKKYTKILDLATKTLERKLVGHTDLTLPGRKLNQN